ncbi:MAG: phage terminase large subunit [Alphaproteobacteria bacterium]|nr:phage terminase large subunit [Alphaproteobacteria bacterium]
MSEIVQSWDTAIKAGQGNDASACATFREKNGIHYLLDMRVVRLEYPALKRLIISHAEQFLPEVILVEDKASGQSLVQDLRVETHWPVLAIQPKGDKIARLARVSAMIEAGKVALPHHAAWLADFEREITAFPNVPHDDQVDAFSQYLNWVRDKHMQGDVRIRSL